MSALERLGQNLCCSFRSWTSLYCDAYIQCLVFQICVWERVLTLTMIFTVSVLYMKLCPGDGTHFNLDIYCHCLVYELCLGECTCSLQPWFLLSLSCIEKCVAECIHFNYNVYSQCLMTKHNKKGKLHLSATVGIWNVISGMSPCH